MGNNLCKTKVEQTSDSKNPIDRVIGRCVQICPSSFAKNDQNYWQRHIFETRPPSPSPPSQPNYPKPNEWHVTTLKVSTDPGYHSRSLDTIPIAPPRRKRSSQISLDDKPGGFKEVFGDLEPDPLAQDAKGNHSDTIFLNQHSVTSEEFADFSKDIVDHSTDTKNRSLKRRISKVGNKKSDKFFGENLSDCLSNEPVDSAKCLSLNLSEQHLGNQSNHTKQMDRLDHFVEKNVNMSQNENDLITVPVGQINEELVVTRPLRKEKNRIQTSSPTTSISNDASEVDGIKDKNSSLNRRAEFLMTLLEGYNNMPEKNANMSHYNSDLISSVEESIIVPIRTYPKQNDEHRNDMKIISDVNIEKSTFKIESNAKDNEEKHQKTGKHVNFAAIPNNFNENLISEFEDTSDNIYANMEPVQELIIVPKRKITKHICDDHDNLHKIIHPIDAPPPPPPPSSPAAINQYSNASTVEPLLQNIEKSTELTGPKKPIRDFERYSKPLEMTNQITELIQKPVRKNRRSLSRDSLPTPPPRPERKYETLRSNNTQNITESLSNESDKLEESSQNILQSNKKTIVSNTDVKSDILIHPLRNDQIILPNGVENIETLLKKCNSSQSFLTQDLMNDIVNKVSDFTMIWNDSDQHTTEDFSTQVMPISKVTSRKISTSRMEREKEINEIEEQDAEQKRNLCCMLEKSENNEESQQKLTNKSQENIKSLTQEFLAYEKQFLIDQNYKIKTSRNNRKTGNVRLPIESFYQDLEYFTDHHHLQKSDLNLTDQFDVQVNNKNSSLKNFSNYKDLLNISFSNNVHQLRNKDQYNTNEENIPNIGILSEIKNISTIIDNKNQSISNGNDNSRDDDTSDNSDSSVVTAINTKDHLINKREENGNPSNKNDRINTIIQCENEACQIMATKDTEKLSDFNESNVICPDEKSLKDHRKDSVKVDQFIDQIENDISNSSDHSILMKFFDDSKNTK